MRQILHPGPVAAQRATVVPTALRPVRLTLPAGQSLLQAVARALAAHDAHSAVLWLEGGPLFPFAWVMPALARTPEHAVYFSERFDADAPVQLQGATVTVGLRDGAPSLHAHGDWCDAQGRRHVGHLLPQDVVLAEAMAAQAWLLDGAAFSAQADAETRFTLFQPMAAPTEPTEPAEVGGTAPTASGRRALAVRLAPNVDLCSALEALCRDHGIHSATVRGGVGSTVGAVFDDGRVVAPFVTELLIRQGRIQRDAHGQPQALIDISLVDHLGGLADGRLARGANPVLVTCELVLEPD